jgi:hypothetical protein
VAPLRASPHQRGPDVSGNVSWGGGKWIPSLCTTDGGTYTVAQFRAWSHGSCVHLVLQTRALLSSYRRASTVLSMWFYDGRSGRGFLL